MTQRDSTGSNVGVTGIGLKTLMPTWPGTILKRKRMKVSGKTSKKKRPEIRVCLETFGHITARYEETKKGACLIMMVPGYSSEDGYQPAESVVVVGKDNLVKLHRFLGRQLKRKREGNVVRIGGGK